MNDIEVFKEVSQTYSVDVESIVLRHTTLVKKIAYHLHSKFPRSVQIDDLVQSGMVGLIEAAKNFDSNKSHNFEMYASIRIRGMILDDLRKDSWMPRVVHHNMRKIAEAIRQIEHRLGREVRDEEIADELDISIEEYFEMARDAHANYLFSLDELSQEHMTFDEQTNNPFDLIENEELKEHLINIIKELPERERLILSFYYNERLRFKEIGEMLNVSEARISQLHTQAIARLQVRIKRIIKQK